MSIFNKPRVEVTVTSDVEVTVRKPDAPLPPLPMRELPPFAEKPACSACRSTRVEFAYWPRYHDGRASGFYVGRPYTYDGLYGRTPEQQREDARIWAEVHRKRATMPRHIDLACTRCRHAWVMDAAPEEEAA